MDIREYHYHPENGETLSRHKEWFGAEIDKPDGSYDMEDVYGKFTVKIRKHHVHGAPAIYYEDGHSEHWIDGYPGEEDVTLPAIITDYGKREEFWRNHHAVTDWMCFVTLVDEKVPLSDMPVEKPAETRISPKSNRGRKPKPRTDVYAAKQIVEKFDFENTRRRIIDIIQRSSFSISQIAELCGTTEMAVNRWLSDKAKKNYDKIMPGLSHLVTLASIMDMKISDLIVTTKEEAVYHSSYKSDDSPFVITYKHFFETETVDSYRREIASRVLVETLMTFRFESINLQLLSRYLSNRNSSDAKRELPIMASAIHANFKSLDNLLYYARINEFVPDSFIPAFTSDNDLLSENYIDLYGLMNDFSSTFPAWLITEINQGKYTFQYNYHHIIKSLMKLYAITYRAVQKGLLKSNFHFSLPVPFAVFLRGSKDHAITETDTLVPPDVLENLEKENAVHVYYIPDSYSDPSDTTAMQIGWSVLSNYCIDYYPDEKRHSTLPGDDVFNFYLANFKKQNPSLFIYPVFRE